MREMYGTSISKKTEIRFVSYTRNDTNFTKNPEAVLERANAPLSEANQK